MLNHAWPRTRHFSTCASVPCCPSGKTSSRACEAGPGSRGVVPHSPPDSPSHRALRAQSPSAMVLAGPFRASWSSPLASHSGETEAESPTVTEGKEPVCLPGTGEQSTGTQPPRKERASRMPPPPAWKPSLCPWAGPASAHSKQVAYRRPTDRPAPPWAQRLGFRVDHLQAPSVGGGLGKRLNSSFSLLCNTPSPERGPGKAQGTSVPWGAGQAGGCTHRGPGSVWGSHLSCFRPAGKGGTWHSLPSQPSSGWLGRGRLPGLGVRVWVGLRAGL